MVLAARDKPLQAARDDMKAYSLTELYVLTPRQAFGQVRPPLPGNLPTNSNHLLLLWGCAVHSGRCTCMACRQLYPNTPLAAHMSQALALLIKLPGSRSLPDRPLLDRPAVGGWGRHSNWPKAREHAAVAYSLQLYSWLAAAASACPCMNPTAPAAQP